MSIAPLEPSDIDELVAFIVDYKRERNTDLTEAQALGLRPAAEQVIQSENSYAYKYAAEGKKLSGYMIVHIVGFPMIGGKELYISELFIGADERAKGIGRRFIEKAEEIAKMHNCNRIMLNNPKEYESYKRAFYSKLGFTERVNFANFVKPVGR